ncbi:hypothetical protein ABEB36_003412 [Hypothenemus hampei]|uniref:Guanine nucleotide exchange factor MSS4 n=1 Tax=Hypothenemus hampei TaxID=57062 RepID=A0ABD1F9G5_HYPHA
MPDCSATYETEVEEGQNKRVVKCKFCSSIILTPTTAAFSTFEYDLPVMKPNKDSTSPPETENISYFWAVKDMFTFFNVGFSNTVGNTKYLTCADCEAGPIGYHDITSKMSYVALPRVSHSDPV